MSNSLQQIKELFNEVKELCNKAKKLRNKAKELRDEVKEICDKIYRKRIISNINNIDSDKEKA